MSKFNMNDFDKGLMLNGLVPPATVNDLEERENLEAFEKSQGEEYFSVNGFAYDGNEESARANYEEHKEENATMSFEEFVESTFPKADLCTSCGMPLETDYQKQEGYCPDCL